ncbi:MAG: cation diffusion facilitator family transporter [Brachymonas sp.]|nr:cation diffusion facilitator family transporter [Brachymonas sp.]
MTLPRPKTLLFISACVAVLTILFKMGAWYVTGSVGFLSDGLESFVNLAGAVFALIMVIIAERPADSDHPHGHHKAEYFSSGFEGLLIVAAALGIVWMAIDRLLHPQPLQQLGWGMGLSLISTLLNGGMAWALLKAAQVHRSIALEANGKHLRTDVYTTIGVIAALGLGALTGWQWVDPLIAILMALNILREGGELIHRSSQGLMDSTASGEVNQLIHDTLKHLKSLDTFNHPEIFFDHVMTRAAGQRIFASMHLHLPAHWSLRDAAELRNQVEQALIAAVPTLHVTIELMPCDLEPVRAPLNTPLHGTTASASPADKPAARPQPFAKH